MDAETDVIKSAAIFICYLADLLAKEQQKNDALMETINALIDEAERE